MILRAKLSGGLVGQAMSNVTAGLTGSRMERAVFELAQALSRLELVCSDWVSLPAEAVFEAARAVALATRILGPTSEEILVLRRNGASRRRDAYGREHLGTCGVLSGLFQPAPLVTRGLSAVLSTEAHIAAPH